MQQEHATSARNCRTKDKPASIRASRAANIFARPWLTNLLLIAVGVGMLCFTQQLVREFHHFSIGFSGVAGWSILLYLLASLTILMRPADRLTLPIIITVAIACRLVTLFPPPAMSTDIYRYVWDGIVQHAHISPYRYVPADPALTFLRTSHPHIFDNINRRNYAHTIYPPGAQILFFLSTAISPTVTFMKLTMSFFEGLTIFALIELLNELALPRERILLYAWCPLLLWEIGSSGHLDVAAMACIALALLARIRQKPIATGLFLAAATLIKFYPLVLFPALYRRADYKMPSAALLFALLCYGAFASAGTKVFGFLGGYLHEEGLDSGTRFFLLELVHRIPGLHDVPTAAYLLFCAAVFSFLILWCWRTCCRSGHHPAAIASFLSTPVRAQFLVPAAVLATSLMLLFSPHYPWYVAWLIPFLVLLPSFSITAYTLGLFYLCTTPLGAGTPESQFHLNCILYPAVLLGFTLDLLVRAKLLRSPDTLQTT